MHCTHSAERTFVLDIGQYACRISGDSELISLIPEDWTRFLSKNDSQPAAVTLRLEEAAIDAGNRKPDGWVISDRNSSQQAVYVSKGIALFALQCCDANNVTVCVRKAMDSYVRIGLHYGLLLALHRECVGLHGVTILCGDEVVVLSAPSGTGKSTLAHLLETHCDAITINGDFALLSMTEEGVVFEPTPFCGTSGRCLNHRVRIDRVVFLSQAAVNEWRELNGREAMTQFMSNAFVPVWNDCMAQTVQKNISRCISALRMSSYAFAPTQEAAELFSQKLQSIVDQKGI